MNLRSKIDKLLQDGYPISEDPADGVALPTSTVLRLIEVLEGSKVAIRGIEVWRLESFGPVVAPVPTEEEFECRRIALEPASDYASRSRNAVLAYLESRQDDGRAIFAVDFDEQQEAA